MESAYGKAFPWKIISPPDGARKVMIFKEQEIMAWYWASQSIPRITLKDSKLIITKLAVNSSSPIFITHPGQT
jgi:hypothetical protein